MNFNEHLGLKNSHAVFGASKSSWLRYSMEKMKDTLKSSRRSLIGTELHDFAASQIELGHKINSVRNLKDNIETYIYWKYYNKDILKPSPYADTLLSNILSIEDATYASLKDYINDGVRYVMTTEQPLVYSELFYGKADTICFRNNVLRIHDLKTGTGTVNEEQLYIYATFFCLEYGVDPNQIEMFLRIYQNGEIKEFVPDPIDILSIMEQVENADVELRFEK